MPAQSTVDWHIDTASELQIHPSKSGSSAVGVRRVGHACIGVIQGSTIKKVFCGSCWGRLSAAAAAAARQKPWGAASCASRAWCVYYQGPGTFCRDHSSAARGELRPSSAIHAARLVDISDHTSTYATTAMFIIIGLFHRFSFTVVVVACIDYM